MGGRMSWALTLTGALVASLLFGATPAESRQARQCVDHQGRSYLSFSPCMARERGLKKMVIWLDPETLAELRRIMEGHSLTEEEAVTATVRAFDMGSTEKCADVTPKPVDPHVQLKEALRSVIREELDRRGGAVSAAPAVGAAEAAVPATPTDGAAQSALDGGEAAPNAPAEGVEMTAGSLTFGQRVEEARTRLGWEIKQLGLIAGVRAETIRRIEEGKIRPTDSIRERLETVLFGASGVGSSRGGGKSKAPAMETGTLGVE
ncbi:MAG: hypothetical protein HQL50_11120 [Magnetococcales bacterium]|nr:hypothetical protein [Magnetococcales bacterium]